MSAVLISLVAAIALLLLWGLVVAQRRTNALLETALALVTVEGEPDACPHPQTEREVMPGSTMTAVTYRCKACGQEGIR